MTTYTFQELLDRLRQGDESVDIEAKPGNTISRSTLQTVSALSNEPGRGGGYILFGVVEEEASLFDRLFAVAGVRDPGKLQADLATQCRNDLSSAVRPVITVEQHNSKTVVVAFVPEAPPSDKPVYIKSEGLPRGAYRRIGNTDQHCTDDDLAVLYQGRSVATYDATAVEGSTLNDVEPLALAEYRRQRAKLKPDAAELALNDEELLYALGATTSVRGEQRLTIAGMVLFGKESSLRRFFPMMRVDYIRVEGREWVPDPEKRYSAVEMRGPLLTLIPRVASQVLADIPAAFALEAGELHRRDVPLIPRTVIREAVVNALMHRTYRVASPVQIIRYANRIELRNPGASLVAEDRLGEPGSFPRNEKVAAVLHEVGLAETKGTGIRAMRTAMHNSNLTPPLFESDRQKDEFGVMLLVHHLLSPEDVTWLGRFRSLSLSDEEARALVVIREAGVITNAMYRDINSVDTLTASGTLRRLRDAGLLEQKGKGRGTFYLPTPLLLGNGKGSGSTGQVEVPPSGVPLSEGLQSLSEGLATLSEGYTGLPGGLSEPLPPGLQGALKSLGKRAQPEEVKNVIVQLCAWRPMRLAQLGALLGRSADYIRGEYIYPLVQSGRIEYTIPETPAHPQQAYRTRETGQGGPSV
jgi:ATP-dependent DNA helicase RecG